MLEGNTKGAILVVTYGRWHTTTYIGVGCHANQIIQLKKRLSSLLTYAYKFVIPPIWTVGIIWFTFHLYEQTKDSWVLLILVSLAAVPLSLIPKFITFDEDNIYISNGFREIVHPIKDLKAINEPYNFNDPFFELEFSGDKNGTIKYQFMAKLKDQLDWFVSNKLYARLLELKNLREKIYSSNG